jgi:tetratricopeptide (TPR) repeat protein
MRSLPTYLFIMMALAGCTRSAETKSDDDISVGDQKVSDAAEMQTIETADQHDDSRMTQVDPDLKQEARAAFDKAIEDDPKNPEAYYARGFNILSDSNQTDAAIVDFNKAIELNPKDARAYLMRGRAYEALGDKDHAKADHDKALELEPGID